MKQEKHYVIFLVEDDAMLAEEMEKLLTRWGYRVYTVKMFDSILEEFVKVKPHVVLMDINIPSFDGFYWCSRIREISHVPVIYVSSRDSSMDIIMGMNTGGDDYIQKPFDNAVLVAKIQAIIRRTYEYGLKEPHIMEYKGLTLNLDEASAAFGSKNIELTKNELKILRLLMENKGRIVTRQALMRSLWDDEIYVNENTLTVNVNRLRTKLEELGLNGFIATKKGMGYVIL